MNIQTYRRKFILIAMSAMTACLVLLLTMINLVNAFSGYLLVLFPWCGGLGIALPVAAVNMVLNLLPTALLRYNTLPLWHLYKKQGGTF